MSLDSVAIALAEIALILDLTEFIHKLMRERTRNRLQVKSAKCVDFFKIYVMQIVCKI